MGVVIMLVDAPVYVKSGKQKIVTRSSVEAELVGISDALSQILWCKKVSSRITYTNIFVTYLTYTNEGLNTRIVTSNMYL